MSRAPSVAWSCRLAAWPLLAALSTTAHASGYEFETVSRPGASATFVSDINNHGQIVGRSTSDGVVGSQAFLLDHGTYTALAGPSGAVSSSAYGISDGGVVVGSYFSTIRFDDEGHPFAAGPARAFIYSAGAYTSFDVPGARDTYAQSVSPDGRYVSGHYDGDGISTRGFVLDTLTHGFTLVGDGDPHFTFAAGINAGYTMVGSDFEPGSAWAPGFMYAIGTGGNTEIALPGAVRTAFTAIDDTGIVSGWFSDHDVAYHGFTGYPGAVEVVDMPGSRHTVVDGSNNDGVLVGSYGLDHPQAFIARPMAAAVPEPQVWALMLAGIALLPLVRRRR